MAGLAGLVAGVIFHVDLREIRRTSDECTMTLCAENLGVRQLGNVFSGIGGVLGERTVTGFAIDVGVLAGGLNRDDIAVAVFTSSVAGVDGLAGGDLCKSIAAIVSVLAEAARNKVGAESDEDKNACYEDNGKTKQVLRVFKSCYPEICHPNSLGRKNECGPMGET